MDSYDVVYASKKFFLCHEVRIAEYMITNKSSYFEYFNFNSEVVPTEKEKKDEKQIDTSTVKTKGVELLQEYVHEFEIISNSWFNSLCIFNWIDVSLESKPDDLKDIFRFPFGDDRLASTKQSEAAK